MDRGSKGRPGSHRNGNRLLGIEARSSLSMRISLLINSLDEGGAQRQLSNLAMGLHRRGDDVLVLSAIPGGKFSEELSAHGIRVSSCNKITRNDLRYLYRLAEMLRQEAPDVLSCSLIDSNVIGMVYKAISPKTPVVMGIRNDSPNRWPETRVARILPFLEQRLSRFADAIVVNSVRGQIHAQVRGIPIERIRQVDNGIDTDLFRPDEGKRAATRSEWGIAEDEVLIGFVGRQHPQKGIPVFLEAARQVADCCPSARFVIIGRSLRADYSAELRTIADALDLRSPLLRWSSSYPDMQAVNNAFDLLVSSSFTEGFPNNVAEALACGTPCVVADVGDSARIVADPRRVVPPGDPKQLAHACLQVVGDTSADGGANLRALVLGFDIDSMVERTRAVYVDVLTRRANSRLVAT
jgi:glycosyltransferase involved in cell wall biosynthesis